MYSRVLFLIVVLKGVKQKIDGNDLTIISDELIQKFLWQGSTLKSISSSEFRNNSLALKDGKLIKI